jgi:acyl-CoA dehydrogenase
MGVEGADLMRYRAAGMFDEGEPCEAEANMALFLAAEASWEAANVAMRTFGGYGYDAPSTTSSANSARAGSFR